MSQVIDQGHYTRQGNLSVVAQTVEELFGGPAFVAIGYPGDGLWTDLGWIPNVSITRSLFSQGQNNEAMQTPGRRSNLQAYSGGAVNLTLLRFNPRQMAALYPSIIKIFEKTSTQEEGMGHSLRPGLVNPPGMLVKPIASMGSDGAHKGDWWLPAVMATSDDMGNFVYKRENSGESEETFNLSFKQAFLTEDWTPGVAQTIADGGEMFYRGDSTHVVTSTWAKNLPFGYLLGRPGAPTTFEVSTAGLAKLTAPIARYIEDGYPVTGYKFYVREADTGSAFSTTASDTTKSKAEASTGIDVTDSTAVPLAPEITFASGKTYEVRVAAKSSKGEGQFAVAFFTHA